MHLRSAAQGYKIVEGDVLDVTAINSIVYKVHVSLSDWLLCLSWVKPGCKEKGRRAGAEASEQHTPLVTHTDSWSVF